MTELNNKQLELVSGGFGAPRIDTDAIAAIFAAGAFLCVGVGVAATYTWQYLWSSKG